MCAGDPLSASQSPASVRPRTSRGNGRKPLTGASSRRRSFFTHSPRSQNRPDGHRLWQTGSPHGPLGRCHMNRPVSRKAGSGLPIVLSIALAMVTPSVARGQTTCVPTVPCTDKNGCPGLIVDGTELTTNLALNRETWTSSDCAVVEGEVAAGDRWLLRFDIATPNLGPGDLIIGKPTDHPEWYDLVTCHGHPHFKQYSDYR